MAEPLTSRIRTFFIGAGEEPVADWPDSRGGIPLSQAMIYPGWQADFVRQHLSASVDPLIAGQIGNYAEPVLQMTSRLPGFGAVHETQMLLWHAMRQYSPTLDSAIQNRRTLEGEMEVVSDDEGLSQAMNDFAEEVAVGYLGGGATLRGLNTYLDMLSERADEYGMAAGEMQLDQQGRMITRLVVPNVRTLMIQDKDGDDIWELYQNQTRKGLVEISTNPNVHTLSFKPPVEGPWPPPMCWSATKVVEATLRIVEAVINGWWRFGDPSLILGHKFDKDAIPSTFSETFTLSDGTTQTAEVFQATALLKQAVESVLAYRALGIPADAYTSVKGGELINEVLGSVNTAMTEYFNLHASEFNAEIVSLSETPVWMYPHVIPGRKEGLGGNLANAEALLASKGAEKRNRVRERIAKKVLDLFLILDGSPQFLSRYGVEFTSASIIDEQALASARKTRAEAEKQEIENVTMLFGEDGTRKFTGEAATMLEEKEIYMAA